MSEIETLRAEVQALREKLSGLQAELDTRPRIERSPMFALMDNLPVELAAISADGRLEWASYGLRRWLTGSRSDLIGAPFLTGVVEALRPEAEEMVRLALSGEVTHRDVSIQDRDGSLSDLRITTAPRRLQGDDVNGCVWIGLDVTHFRLADEALSASELRLRLATDAGGVGVWDWDLVGMKAIFSDRARAICGFPLDGEITPGMANRAIHPEDRQPAQAMTRRAVDPEIRAKSAFSYRVVKADGSTTWVRSHGEAIFALRDGVETAVRYIGTIQDVTEQTLAAQRQQLLMHELNHRVKNTLASVQSIAQLTLRNDQSPEVARNNLTERLLALSRAHDILTRENWEAADLADIVRVAVEPFNVTGDGRFETQGPRIRVSPKTAVALALCLHELATNAAKYGALSNDAGRVAIAWRLDDTAENVHVEWREIDGPPVTPPTHTGFGTRLLTRGLAAEFGGEARVTYAPDGVVCQIDASLAQTSPLDLG